VSYSVSSADNCAGQIVTQTAGLASGATFPVGTTVNTFVVTDAAGNTATCSFSVTVKDAEAPTITCPGDITVNNDLGVCGAKVSYTVSSADNCAGQIVTQTAGLTSGATFPVGTTVNTFVVTDAAGNTATCSFSVTVKDAEAPTITCPGDIIVNNDRGVCGAKVSYAINSSDNCSGQTVQQTAGLASGSTFPVGTTVNTFVVTDAAGNTATCSFSVTVKDAEAPVITCPANIVGNADPLVCTALVNFAASATDNCSAQISYDVGGTPISSPFYFPVGLTTVHAVAKDPSGNSSECSFTVTVLNPAPVVALTGPASGSLYAINTAVNFTATFTDVGGGTHTGVWSFDSLTKAATITEPSGSNPGSATASYTFTAAGVYTVKLVINDSCGDSGVGTQIGGMNLLVVVYDPSAGFVTGGGWINSPAGAYAADPLLSGKANFGFVSKYQKGANTPTGNTEFQFKAGNLNFSSTSYEWLVVSGAKAQYKGSGTINGAGDFGFLLTATDGQVTGGGGTDKFRIKIWSKASGGVVYDNGLGAPDDIDTANPQAIGGGSIVIHK
jgi:hypothetical protein